MEKYLPWLALKSLALTIVMTIVYFVYATKIVIIFQLATILVPKLIPNMQKELLKKCNKHFSSNDIHVAEQSEPVVLSPEPVGSRIVVADGLDEDERG